MAKRLTDEDKLRINEVYYLTKNYTKTAKETGFSVASVRKYVDPNFEPMEKKNIKKFNAEELSVEINLEPFVKSENWGEFCELSDKEKEDIKELWKELIV